ncbi:MAG: DNA-binding protein WhiA [Clostridia bacterium]|nr:DNA-binding protein WhiA [Clostridia bacterium]
MLFECMNDKILREIRNDTNRRANCETGNIMKAVNASQEIITAIKKIENAGLLEALPEDLRKTAEIRMDFPEASLSEMCSKFTPTLSKSGLNHRLTRIKKFAEDIK